MTAKYYNFVDGQRLPGDRVKEFLMNQAVIQCANQTEITGSGIEALGARVALNLEDGQLWTYGGDPASWAPAQNALDLELLDARYLTRLAADGLYLTELVADGKYLTDGQAAQKYLTIVTAQGLYITEGEADGKYLTPAQASALYLTPLDADARYITLVSAGQIYLRKDDASTTYQTQPSSGTFITDIQAGQIYLSQTNAASTYITQVNAGELFISKGGAAGDINSNATTISGGKITTNSINVNRLIAGTLTGFRIQTSSSGQRVVVSESSNSVSFWYSTSGEGGRITGSSDDGGSLVIEGPDTSSRANLTISSTNVNTNKNLSSSLGVYAGERLGSYLLRSSSTRYANIMNDSSGNLSLGAVVSSDERIKENIQPTTLGLDFVNDLNPVQFEFITKEIDLDNGPQFGVIAQELKATLAEHGVSEENGMVYKSFYGEGEEDYLYSVNRDQFVAPLIKAIQELSAKNDALEARLAALESAQ